MTAGPRAPRLLLAGMFVLFAAWSFVVPIYESPDEPSHWQYARHLRQHWTLPLYTPGFIEANQPPVAYLLFAPVAVSDGSPDIALSHRPNGDLVGLAGPRRFLNTAEAYRQFWPQRIARLEAAAISTVTVFFVWRAGLAAGGQATGLLAALLAGLLPMFSFRAGGISNDVPVACFSAAATWGLVRLVREPYTWRTAWWTSAAIGVAYLCKITALALVPAFALALLTADPSAPWRAKACRLGALALAGVLVAPWSIRNVVLYGDPFASEAMRHSVASLITDRPLLSSYFVGEFPRVLGKSFIGVFGWASVQMPKIAYGLYLVLFAVGFAGVGVAVVRKRIVWRIVAVLGLACLAAVAIVVRINLQFTQPQGRYLMNALPAFAVLVALGLRSIPPPFSRVLTPAVIGLALLAGNLYVLRSVVLPAYHPAPIRTLATGERAMVPSLLSDMAVLEGESHWVVTGPKPTWLAHVDAAADSFIAFEVELTSSTTPTAQRACLVYTFADQPIDDTPEVCTDWQADGQPQVVRLPLRGQRRWTGVVSHVRLAPMVAGPGLTGVEMWTRHPRLVPR